MSVFDWHSFVNETSRCYDSEFMKEMLARREDTESISSTMGRLDAAALYALVKIKHPQIVLETGSFRGMSSAFILKGMQDAHVSKGTLFSIDRRQDCGIGALIPSRLKPAFVPLVGDVKELLACGKLPAIIDLFLHDSTHRYRHQMWEFDTFWPMLQSGGVLVSHDVNLNASFVDFVSRTYFHNPLGQRDQEQTSHATWGAVGTLGFVVKA
jgi:predicted O-methyltransferase YrrM